MKQSIAEKIISDAQAEAESIIAQAQEKAENILAEAKAACDKELSLTQSATDSKVKDVAERKAALARLDGAKVALAEKHRVISAVYADAEERLLSLSKEDAVRFIGGLLEKFADEGDGVYLAEGFAYEAEVKCLPVFAAKKLRLSESRMPISGGVFLKGEKADKDLSIKALLSEDKDENSAALAAELFDR